MPETPVAEAPPYVRPDVRNFLVYLNAMPGPRTHEMTAEAARQVYAGARAVTDVDMGELAVVRDLVIPGPAGNIPARLFDAQPTRAPGPVVIFFHGGGFVIGDLDTHAPLCAEIARTLRLPVVSVGYRLAPEHRWPAAPDDAEAAARWVAGSPAGLGLNATGLVLMGDSAGGTLTVTTALALRDDPAAVPVIVQAPIYPAVDPGGHYESYRSFADGYLLTAPTLRWFGDAYAADLQHMRGSPLNADLSGLPPAVVITAGLDPLRDQGRAYVAKLAHAGVPVTYREAVGTIHGFATLRRAIPSAQGDMAGYLTAVAAMVAEVEGARVQAQAAG